MWTTNGTVAVVVDDKDDDPDYGPGTKVTRQASRACNSTATAIATSDQVEENRSIRRLGPKTGREGFRYLRGGYRTRVARQMTIEMRVEWVRIGTRDVDCDDRESWAIPAGLGRTASSSWS